MDAVLRHVSTAFLFSDSDVVSILGPTLAVALVLAGPTDIGSFVSGFIWLELHLIAFEIKNQIVGVEEDKLSKPHRPIVSGRVTLQEAQRYYVVAVALALLFSVYHDLLPCSMLYMLCIMIYNEGQGARNWILKSWLAAIGYCCYCWGTTRILDHGSYPNDTSCLAVLISGALHVTTGYAQDFRDREGDAAIGRKTLPLILSQSLLRWLLLINTTAWTAGLVYLWSPPILFGLAFAAVGLVSTVNFVRDYSLEADRNSYFWYNLWLIGAHFLPVFTRISGSA